MHNRRLIEKSNKQKLYLTAVAAGLLTLSACTTAAQAPENSSLTQVDLDALTAAYQLINFDLQECELLPAHTSAPQVTAVATKICSDAARFQPLVEQLAAAHNVTLPNSLSYNLRAQYGALNYRPWPSFDVNYLQDQIASHEQALALFGEEGQETHDPNIKAFVKESIPVVQDNLQRLRLALSEVGSN